MSSNENKTTHFPPLDPWRLDGILEPERKLWGLPMIAETIGVSVSKARDLAPLRAEKQDDKNATYQIFRAELIKARRCQICNGPIPERKFRGAKFCSKKCEKSLDNPAQRLKIMKTCPHCKQAFHPITAGQIHCGHKCAGRAAALAGRNLPPQKYPPRDYGNCEVCGTRFLKKERHTRYCSRQCWFQSQHQLTAKRLDRILGAAPPRRFPLTAARLDRVFKETRPKRLKRPFNWRLTAARLDAMLERVDR